MNIKIHTSVDISDNKYNIYIVAFFFTAEQMEDRGCQYTHITVMNPKVKRLRLKCIEIINLFS